MPSTYKVLGQEAPAATTLTTLYTVPAGKSAVCSTLTVCNRGNGTKFRVAVSPNGTAIENKHYIVYDGALTANDSTFLTLGISLAEGDVVRVYSDAAHVSFGLFGTELS